MALTKGQLDDEDFPLEAQDMSVTTRDGVLVATAQTPGLAKDFARRLNEDAERRHEGSWSA